MARKRRARFSPQPLKDVRMKDLVGAIKEMDLTPALTRHCIEWIAGVEKDFTQRTFQRGLKVEDSPNASAVYLKSLLRLFTGDKTIARYLPKQIRDGILVSCDADPIGQITTSPLVRFAHVLDAIGDDPARRARLERTLKIMEDELAGNNIKP